MITKWKVCNFKSIREETELEFAPLTIFAGANSSGKSTIIQSVLLLAQSLADKVSSRPVVLNGTHVKLGQFNDLKSNKGDSDQITIGCTCHPVSHRRRGPVDRRKLRSIMYTPVQHQFSTTQISDIDCEISFDTDGSSSEREILQIQPRLLSTQLSCISVEDENTHTESHISIKYSGKPNDAQVKQHRSSIEVDDRLIRGLDYDVKLDKQSEEEVKAEFISAESVGITLNRFLPEFVICKINPIRENADTIIEVMQEERPYISFVRSRRRRRNLGTIMLTADVISVLRKVLEDTIDFDRTFRIMLRKFKSNGNVISLANLYSSLHDLPRSTRIKIANRLRTEEHLFERLLTALENSDSNDTPISELVPIPIPRSIQDTARYLTNFFNLSLKYLGPLRDEPKPLYPLVPGVDPHDVGLRGEHTAFILELHKNRVVEYIPSTNFLDSQVNSGSVTQTLEKAVADWLQYLGVASSVQSQDRGKLGYEMKVGISGSDLTHDLTHVGVGVSQVLPILVMCLLANHDSTLVFEQPELHLHPKVQTLLGDFFLSMALCNKQCLVETHSEYLIDRLRFRIASASLVNGLTEQIKIYSVEKPSQSSNFKEIEINEFGAIVEWPEGFFDQSQEQAEKILTAAVRKRKFRKDNRHDST